MTKEIDPKFAEDASRELACILDQHDFIPDDEDIRFRYCRYCGLTQYCGKEVKGGKKRPKRK